MRVTARDEIGQTRTGRLLGLGVAVALLGVAWLAGQAGVGGFQAGRAPAAYADEQPLGAALLAEGERRQVIQFNPGAALQKRIFADGFVPNSPEFQLEFDGTAYAAQRAESLGTGAVRVYYVVVGDWGSVQLVSRDKRLLTRLANALVTEGEGRQVMQFNPGAALQKRIFADRFVPNSPEFSVEVAGVAYTGQRAEDLATGRVRVYYVVTGQWGNVMIVGRTGADVTSGQASTPTLPRSAGEGGGQGRGPEAWYVTRLVVGAGTPGLVYALERNGLDQQRLMVSDDLGATWRGFGGGLPGAPVENLTLDYATPDSLYASTRQGLYRYTGQGWSVVNSGPAGTAAIPYGQPGVVWAVVDGRLTFTDDAGRTWHAGGSPTGWVEGMAIDPRSAKTAYVLGSVKGWWFSVQRGSAEPGLSAEKRAWGALPVPRDDGYHNVTDARGMTLDGATGDVYLAVGNGGVCSSSSQIWRSRNPDAPNAEEVRWELVHDFGRATEATLLGSGWSPRGLALFANLRAVPGGESCYGQGEPRLSRSLDGGQSWEGLTVR